MLTGRSFSTLPGWISFVRIGHMASHLSKATEYHAEHCNDATKQDVGPIFKVGNQKNPAQKGTH